MSSFGTPLFTNFARTTLASGISSGAGPTLTVALASGTGALFPSPSAGQYFPLVLTNTSGAKEVFYCTSRTTDALTCTRAQEGTTAQTFNSGDLCGLRLTEGSLADLAALGQSFTAVEATVASATTTAIGGAASVSIDITGTAAITAFDTVASGVKRLCRATGAFTLTNSGALVCPGGANIVAAAGDLFWAESLGSGNWVIGPYQCASGAALVGSTLTAAAPINISGGIINLSGIVGVPNGGTGLATLPSGNLLVGAGTGNVSSLAFGTAGNVVTDTGSAWTSQAPAATTFNAVGSYSIGFAVSLAVGRTYSASAAGVAGGSGTWRCMGTIQASTGGCCPTNGIYLMARTA